MQFLHAPPFLLRPLRADDAHAFAAAVRESMDTVGTWMDWARPDYAVEHALDWFARCDASRVDGTAHEFGIFDAAGDVVGGAGLNQFNAQHGFCNLGYWVRASQQRRGAAVAAVQALARFAFETLGLSRVEIVVAVGNDISRAVADKAGAACECVARNRLRLHGAPVDAYVHRLLPAAPDRVVVRPADRDLAT